MTTAHDLHIPVKIGASPTLQGIRGVIAVRNIQAGECIESCPIISIPITENVFIERTVLDHYVYEWREDSDCLVLGYCGLCNHSYDPNARYDRDFATNTMKYYAVRAIALGSEILVNYNGEPDSSEVLDSQYTDFQR